MSRHLPWRLDGGLVLAYLAKIEALRHIDLQRGPSHSGNRKTSIGPRAALADGMREFVRGYGRGDTEPGYWLPPGGYGIWTKAAQVESEIDVGAYPNCGSVDY
jgi:hypothetical protein